MKKIFNVMLVSCIVFTFLGCGAVNSGGTNNSDVISEVKTDVAEDDSVQEYAEENTDGKNTAEQTESKTQISGSFTATVRDIIPDYVLDDTTPLMGVLTLFQDSPFTVYLGENLVSKVEIGETYVFTIETVSVEDSVDEVMSMSVPSLFYTYGLKIVDVRPAEESETGLDSLGLSFE